MSAYDDAVAYLDAEVHQRCDYEIYIDMRGIVDEMEAENARLRKALRRCYMSAATLCDLWDGPCRNTEKGAVLWPCPLSYTKKGCVRKGLRRTCRKLGIEVE